MQIKHLIYTRILDDNAVVTNVAYNKFIKLLKKVLLLSQKVKCIAHSGLF